MKAGIISDSHSNPWGQQTVLREIREREIPIKYTYNLGDVSGMFPAVIEAVEKAREECKVSLLGNHDGVLIHCFEDDPRREERIQALRKNRTRIMLANRQDLFEWFGSLPIDFSEQGVYFVHNSPFGEKNPNKIEYMLARFGQGMRDPKDPKFDSEESRLLQASNFPQQVIVRGHSHLPSVHKIKRGLKKVRNNMVSVERLGVNQDNLEVNIDPDFNYIVTVPGGRYR